MASVLDLFLFQVAPQLHTNHHLCSLTCLLVLNVYAEVDIVVFDDLELL